MSTGTGATAFSGGGGSGAESSERREHMFDLRDDRLRAAVVDHLVFDPNQPHLKTQIIQIVVQYLQDAGYTGAAMVLQDEANIKMRKAAHKRSEFRRMRRAILDGEWNEVEKLLSKTTFKNMKSFRYAVYKQQFLELIDAQENDKAFKMLATHIKELETCAASFDEFRDLCYLLTCKSVLEAPSFYDWDGIKHARSLLVDQYSRWLDFDAFQKEGLVSSHASPTLRECTAAQVPPNRLLYLLQQAVAFQIGSARHRPRVPPKIGTILEDFESVMIPNNQSRKLRGHTGNVKCLSFVGRDGAALATGSSDNTVRIWDTQDATCTAVLQGHTSRVWEVHATDDGAMLASGSGDGTVRLWNMADVLPSSRLWCIPSQGSGGEEHAAQRANKVHGVGIGNIKSGEYVRRTISRNVDNAHGENGPYDIIGGNLSGDVVGVVRNVMPRAILKDHTDDVYTVRFHPQRTMLVSAGYDKTVRIYDVETTKVIRTLHGHQSSISCVAFNVRGNMVITGSKDSTIKYWDIISGMCVKTIHSPLGEVTSVETNQAGTLLVSSSKDNSNRLWDMRTSKPVRRFKGHQNTSKNFIRTAFGPRESQIIGGSEDGFVYVWDIETSEVVTRLGPSDGPTYTARWNARQSVLASGSHDSVATCWHYDPKWELESAQEKARMLDNCSDAMPAAT